MKKDYKIAVIGGGSWATAIVKILSNNIKHVYWWVRETEIKEGVEKFNHNPLYLSDVEFKHNSVIISNDIEFIVSQVTDVIFVVPAAFLCDSIRPLSIDSLKGKKIYSAIKGIIPGRNQIIADFMSEVYEISLQDICIISGPSHAEEIALEKLTYLTFASQNKKMAEFMAARFSCRYVKTSTSDDIYGTEYAAVLKNIYAIAVGISKGLGYGDNFVAVLISNAIQEMEKFIEKVHPINRNLYNSVYLGDLMVTAYSQFSRNRTFGNMIGAGYSVKSAQLEMKMIAEGYFATKGIKEINKLHDVELPIFDAVYNILYENISPFMEMKILSDKLK